MLEGLVTVGLKPAICVCQLAVGAIGTARSGAAATALHRHHQIPICAILSEGGDTLRETFNAKG